MTKLQVDRDISIAENTAEPERICNNEIYQLKGAPEQNDIVIIPEIAAEFWLDFYQIV